MRIRKCFVLFDLKQFSVCQRYATHTMDHYKYGYSQHSENEKERHWHWFEYIISFFILVYVCVWSLWLIVIRELKRQAFLLSRRPNGTKLSADVAYLNTSYGRGDLHGGLQAAFCLRVGLLELRSSFIKGMASSTEQIVNKPL